MVLLEARWSQARPKADGDVNADNSTTSPVKSRAKESIYYGDDDEWNYDMDYHDDAFYEDDLDEHYAYDGDDGTYHEDDEGAEQFYAADEAASEYDEVFAAYVRSRMNQMRLSRGFYPVVALANYGHITSKGNKGKKSVKSLRGRASLPPNKHLEHQIEPVEKQLWEQ